MSMSGTGRHNKLMLVEDDAVFAGVLARARGDRSDNP